MIFMLNECVHSFTCRVSCSFCHIYSEEKQCKQMCPDVRWTDGFPRVCVQNKFETLVSNLKLEFVHPTQCCFVFIFTVYSLCNLLKLQQWSCWPWGWEKKMLWKVKCLHIQITITPIYFSVTVPSWQRHIGADIECFAKKHTFFQTLC